MKSEMSQVKEKSTVYGMACLVVNDENEILLLKRSPNKSLFPNKWFVVGAAPLTIEENKKNVALREIRDELGVEGEILKEGGEVTLSNDENYHISIFLAKISSKNIKLNDEHTEARWIKRADLKFYDLVPETQEMIDILLTKDMEKLA